MFDRNIRVEASDYVPCEKTVKEIKAPTDASIALYAELVEKARAALVRTMQVTNNCISFNLNIYEQADRMQPVCHYLIQINGHSLTGDFDILDRTMLWMNDPESLKTLVRYIVQKLSDVIAAHLLPVVVDSVREYKYHDKSDLDARMPSTFVKLC